MKEVGNIGIGQATTSLAQMVNKKVEISIPNLELIPIIKIPEFVRNEDPVVGIVLQLNGEANGYLLLLLSRDSAKILIRLVLGEVENDEMFNEMEVSVLNELGNIMTGTYVTALSDFLGLNLGLSPPSQVYDMAEAIVNQIVGLMSQNVDEALLLNTEFSVNEEKIDGKILVFTDADSLTRMLEELDKLAG